MKPGFDSGRNEALAQANEALKIEPKNPQVYICIGDIYTRKYNEECSVIAYCWALAIDPRLMKA